MVMEVSMGCVRPEAFRTPLTLHGRYIDLVPVDRSQIEALAQAGRDPAIWEFIRFRPGNTGGRMADLVDFYLERQRTGQDLPFTTIWRDGRRPIGMTRFLDIDRPNNWVEVGGTWLDSAYWRTPINTESKLLMLRHAFDTEQVHRIQIKTDSRNVRSQHAIERLGAVREGVVRDHMILPDGFVRSSVYYSILAREWPEVRTRLERFLARPWDPSSITEAKGPAPGP
jgi:N-acetyltransferase